MPRGRLPDDLFVPSEWLVQSATDTNAAQPSLAGSHFDVDLLQEIAWSDSGIALSDAELDHLAVCPLCQEEVEIAVLGARPDEAEFEPSEALVARVLHAPPVVRRVPSFQMRAHAQRRVAGRVFAALGLTPWSLAAAMVVHVAVFATTGTWIAASTRGLDARLHAPRVGAASEALVYYYTLAPRRASTSPRLRAREQVSATTLPGPTTTLVPESTARSQARLREAARAIDRTFLFEGSAERMRRADSTSLEEIVRVLGIVPNVTIRLEPAVDADAREPGSMVRFANRGAEMIARFLRDRGVDTSRIRVSPTKQAPFGCAATALECLRISQRVRITIDTTTDQQRP